MRAFLLLVVLSYQMMSTISATDCTTVKEKCTSDSSMCRSAWNLLKNVCNVTGESCKVNESHDCNMTIQYMMDSHQELKGCLCTNDDSCNILKMIAPHCIKKTDIQGSAPTPSRHTQHDWPGKLHAVKATTTTAKSCLAALQHCQESRHCSSLYNGLKDVCSTDNGQCDTPDIRHACLSTWRQLQSTALGDCSCAKRGRKKCLKIWSTLYNNSCIQNAQRSVGSSDTESDNTSQEQHNFQPEKDPTGLWELSALAKYEHRSSRSCSDVAKLCLEDEICNRELVPHVKACSESLNQCNVSQCQRAVQLFYDSLPSNVAEILVFCDCSPSDDKCLQVQGLLHSQFCSGQLSHTPTCLEVFDICIEDIFCRHRYKTFQDKCWGAGKLICDGHMGDDCSSYLDEHLMFSGEDACKAAFTGTMGTILQHPCTCYGLENAEELKCKQLHNVLHNRSHFVSHLRRESIPLHSGSLERESTEMSLNSFFNGPVVLICIYIIVIVLMTGVTLLILHKTRICRTAERPRYLPSADTDFTYI